MEKQKAGLIGFLVGDWLGMPNRGKGKATFKPLRSKSYFRGETCSGNTSMLLCALDSHCRLDVYLQNLQDWYFRKKYTGEGIEFDMDAVTQKAIVQRFRGVPSDANSSNRSLAACCALALSSLPKEDILPFVKATHNSRYSLLYNGFFVDFVRSVLACDEKEQALEQAEQANGFRINRQNFCNGSFVTDSVESAINHFLMGNSYKECVFAAANAGKASDTVGALTGFLAGLYYGMDLKNGIRDFEKIMTYVNGFIKELAAEKS